MRNTTLGTWVARGAGVAAVVISLGHLIRLLWLGELNPLAMWTIVVAAVAGAIAISRPNRAGIAALVLMLALLPALFGWAGWLYIAPLVVLLSAALAQRVGQ